jgi:branched-subunit amino acid ABC-type transport system permease component
MYFFFQVALSGVATGAIYGLIAVGYSLTYMTTKALNFALGMWVMLGGMLTYSLIVLHAFHPLAALAIVVAALFALGIVAERFSGGEARRLCHRSSARIRSISGQWRSCRNSSSSSRPHA